jgi:hypothetical protein
VLLGGYFLVQRWLPLPENIDSGVIWAVLIVLFGVSLLADALRKPRKPKFEVHYNGNKGKSSRNLVVEGDRFQYDGSFSDDTALISMDTLSGGEADCSFGNYVLDLSGVNHVTENCNVELDCSFGRLIVLIPRRFAAVIDEDSSFASVETAGRPDDDPLGCIRLACDCSFGSITIKYI